MLFNSKSGLAKSMQGSISISCIKSGTEEIELDESMFSIEVRESFDIDEIEDGLVILSVILKSSMERDCTSDD